METRLGGGIGYEKRNMNLKHESVEYLSGLLYCEIRLGLGDLEIWVVLCSVLCTDRFCLVGDVDMVHGSCVTKL